MLQIVPEKSCGTAHVVLGEIILNFRPHVPVIPLGRSKVDGPSPKMSEVPAFDQTFRLHMAQPYLVVGGENELRVREHLP